MTVSSKLALCGLAGLLCIVALPFRSPSADGAKVDPALPKCPPDWKVEVIAETPKIKHPSVVCCAPDGRIFVAEDPMDMAAASDKPTDRILCFHPDGKVTVFAEQLYAVFGIQYIDGKLYVHHSPKFSVFTDDNGVSKDRVDLIDTTHPAPWTGGFNDHIPSNCRLGMDGYLYFSTGDKGVYGAKGKDGKAIEIHGGGVFRIRPDGTDLEVVSTGTRNHLDVAVTGEDELFTYDNTDDGNGWNTRVTHMVLNGFYGYPWDYKPRRPYTLWMINDFGGGSPCGACAYNEDALPAEYHGNLFLCEWGRSQLLRLPVSRDGGSFKIDKRQDILTKGTKEFRPVGICVTPDGLGFIIADWNYGGWKAKVEAGRLLRFTYTGKSEAAPKPAWFVPAAQGQPFMASIADLIAGLKHPAQSVRLVAQRRLAEKKQDAVKPLTEVLADAKAPAQGRWSAIWALDAVDGGVAGRGAIIAALKDGDASVRRQAARQLGTRRAKEAVRDLTALLKDDDASVRFQAATALGRIGDATAVPALAADLNDKDLFARYAVFTALNHIGKADATAWPAILQGLDSADAAVREGTLFAVRETFADGVAKALAAYVSDAKKPAATRAAAVQALAELHRQPRPWDGKWWGTQPVKSPRPAKVLEWVGTPTVLGAVKEALADPDATVRLAAVEGARIIKDAGLGKILVERFPAEKDAAIRKATLLALADAKDANALGLVATVLRDPTASSETLADAVTAAEKIGGKEAVTALTETVGRDAAPEVLTAALTALGTLKGAPALPAVTKRLTHTDAKVRIAAVNALAGIGGEPAVAPVSGVLGDKEAEVRRAAVQALGKLRAKTAVPALVRAYHDPQTRFDAINALALIPDVRALDVYIDGLLSKNQPQRDACRKAVAAVSAEALPLIEAKLEGALLPAEAIGELQRVYSAQQPIVKWQILGPFANPTMEPFDIAAPPLDKEFKDLNGKPIKWKPAKVEAATGRVNLTSQMTAHTDVNCYAVTEIDSPAEREVELLGGSDDYLTVWVNGKKVFEDLTDKGWKADQYRIRATLKAGKNIIVAKCGNHGGGWEFSLSLPTAKKGKLFDTVVKKLDPKAYDAFALKNKGDAEHGRKMFFDLKGVACAKCHKVRNEGSDVGPDLASVGGKYNRAQLIESLLFPSKQILDGYRQTIVGMSDGRILSGIVRGDTPEELTLIDAEGKKHVLPKKQIEEAKLSDLSLMPEGLNTGMSLQDFADVIAFLESLKDKPIEPKK